MRRVARHAGAVAWPSFLMAGVLEVLVFAFVEPATLRTGPGEALQLSPLAIYSLAFFALWLVVAVACAMTLMLTLPPIRQPQ